MTRARVTRRHPSKANGNINITKRNTALATEQFLQGGSKLNTSLSPQRIRNNSLKKKDVLDLDYLKDRDNMIKEEMKQQEIKFREIKEKNEKTKQKIKEHDQKIKET